MIRMKRNRNFKGYFRAGLLFSLIATVVVILGNFSAASYGRNSETLAWGSESLRPLQEGLQAISPIALANACGLGASSCYKCHNGKRAGEPKIDEVQHPWHAQHRKANNSCVGCHKGNPRIMVKESSHANLINGPRIGDVCSECHKADLAKIETAYKK